MKSYKLILMALCAVALTTLWSCKNEVDDIFPDSAANRMTNAINTYSDLLTANGGKWALEYFSSTSAPGYVFILEFAKDGSVTVSSNNPYADIEEGLSYGSDTSEWEVIGDNGPVLSFNTYNEVFHYFSDPDVSPRGRGFEGDYEFNLMKYENDTLFLNGKKHDMNMFMYRLPESVDKNTFFAAIDDMLKSTVVPYFPTQLLIGSNGKEYVVSGIAGQVVSFYPRTGDAITETVSGNAIATQTGFYFLEPVELLDSGGTKTLQVQHFIRQNDGSFLCTDDNKSVITSYELTTVLTDFATYDWNFENSELGGKFASLYEQINNDSYANNNRRRLTFIHLYFNTSEKFSSEALLFQTGSYQCHFGVQDIQVVGNNKVKFILSDLRDTNGTNLLKKVPVVQEFLDLLANGTFTLSCENALNPALIKFVSDVDPTNYFTLKVFTTHASSGGAN